MHVRNDSEYSFSEAFSCDIDFQLYFHAQEHLVLSSKWWCQRSSHGSSLRSSQCSEKLLLRWYMVWSIEMISEIISLRSSQRWSIRWFCCAPKKVDNYKLTWKYIQNKSNNIDTSKTSNKLMDQISSFSIGYNIMERN